MRRRAFLIFGLILALAAGLAGSALWGFAAFTQPGPLKADKALVIGKGGVEQIARQLAEESVIAHPLVFALALRLTATGGRLKAGEYAFPAGISMEEVWRLLQSGKTVVRKLLVPEGTATADIVRLMTDEAGFTGAFPAVGDGDLLPSTYFYSYGDGRSWMIQRMREEMKKALDELWPKRAPGLPFTTPRDAVTLASIVERETSRASERARVAGVFVNRLVKGMKLEADPTVAYAVSGGRSRLDRPLTKTDLATLHPYNTYLNAGLPPGPIGNPGRAAIAAVLNPDRHAELFFVADGQGGHWFARTLEEHQRNVARWRQIEQGRNAAKPAATN